MAATFLLQSHALGAVHYATRNLHPAPMVAPLCETRLTDPKAFKGSAEDVTCRRCRHLLGLPETG